MRSRYMYTITEITMCDPSFEREAVAQSNESCTNDWRPGDESREGALIRFSCIASSEGE